MSGTRSTGRLEPGGGPGQRSDWFLGLLVISVLMILVLPLPAIVLDVALSLNITLAAVVLLMSLQVRTPLEFSTLPTVLLGATLFRLALNVASTRLILLDGEAGQVIQSFGATVVGGNIIVGLVVFLILVIIQFVVITKGATRISEVAARFTLDAMPGKQMAIDADLNAGLIDQREAIARRERIASEAEFHGAMDGASKFVRGDAVAGLIITAINLLGGVALGMIAGRSFQDALQLFALLTVGDGIVSQVPALLISVAAGVMVTKTTSRDALAKQLGKQVLTKPRAIGIASAGLLLLALFPGMPKAPFLGFSALLFALYRATRHLEGEGDEPGLRFADGAGEAPPEPETPPSPTQDLLEVDRMGLEIGVRLIDLVDKGNGLGLLDHIRNMRRQFASGPGLLVPPVRVKDNLRLGPKEYRVLVGGYEVARGSVEPQLLMAMRPGAKVDDLEGLETVDPTFGFPARWIEPRKRDHAEMQGYQIIDPVTVLVTHLSEVVRSHASDLLTRDDVKHMIDHAKESCPVVVEELTSGLMTLGEIQKVLRNLLKENVPIRNLAWILESLADNAARTKDPDMLTEFVRQRLSRVLVAEHEAPDGKLYAVTLDPEIELRLMRATQGEKMTEEAGPRFLSEVVHGVRAALEEALARGHEAVLLVRPKIRRFVRDLIEKDLPRTAVLSYTEVQSAKHIEPLAMAGKKEAALSTA